MSGMRWIVLSMLLAVTSINYLDRLLLSVLAPVLRDYFHFNESLYGNISGAFQIAYAVGFLVLGRMLDRFGTKTGLAVAATVWSLASAMHATVTGAAQLGGWRVVLGFSESANFPACSKAVAEWFPVEERALATGIFNAGTNLASVIGPPMFVALTAAFGWRACFVGVSLLGVLWVAAWIRFYRTPASVVERRTNVLSFRGALRYRQTQGYILGKVLVDPAWFFLLFWLPLYFRDVRKMEMTKIGWALPLIYFTGGMGSVTAGWFSGFLLRLGWNKRRARLGTLLICAIIVPIAIYGAIGGSMIHAVVMFSIAAAAHQAFSSIAYTIPGDVFPSSAIGTVLGLGGFAGAMSSVVFSAVLPGYLIPSFGYTSLLLTLSFGYLAAVLVTAWLFGNFEPVSLAAELEPVRSSAH
jgi:ACS family hexuronate transporter-like MFS transporter